MAHLDGMAWSRRVFGGPGPTLRRLIPALVLRAHQQMSTAQTLTGMGVNLVYGQIWWKVFQEFAEVIPAEVPGARLIRPPRASYSLAVVNDVPLFPFRYAKDLTTDLASVKMGTSGTRVDIFHGRLPEPDPELPLDWSCGDAIAATGKEVTEDEVTEDEVTAMPFVFESLAGEHAAVVAIPFASSPAGLYQVVWGDARLNDDSTLAFRFKEELEIRFTEEREIRPDEEFGHDRVGGGPFQDRAWGFADEPLTDPVLRPRRPTDPRPGPAGDDRWQAQQRQAAVPEDS